MPIKHRTPRRNAVKSAETKAAAKATTVKKTAAAAKKPAKAKKCDCTLGDAKLTIVVAKIDAGWGNSLYIRGQGAGLSWDKGVLMQCVGDQEWIWEKKNVKENFEFKFLLNDTVWAEGENIAGQPDEIRTYYPKF